MIKKHRTWINLWVDQGGNHCVVTKVLDHDGHRRILDSFFRPSLASAIRLSEIVCNCVARGEGRLYPSTMGVGWSWQRRKK